MTVTETRRYSMLLYGYKLEEDENEAEIDVSEPDMPALPSVAFAITDLELTANNFMYHEDGDLRQAFGNVYFGVGQRLYINALTEATQFNVLTNGERQIVDGKIREFLEEHGIEYDQTNLGYWHFVGWE